MKKETIQNSEVTFVYAKNGRGAFTKDYIFDIEKLEEAWGKLF